MRRSHFCACRLIALAYAGLMTASAAENPCVPNWVWDWGEHPSLGFESCPTGIPDTCVGHHVVGPAMPTATSGMKCRNDVNNCPGSPSCINQTSVPITPVHTWSFYECPPGATPMTGTGTTAIFDTIHGGSVRVHFKTEATVWSPSYWYDYAGCFSSAFRVFEVVVPLAPDQGIEVEDGDGDSRTTTFVVCAGPGDVVVTATPVPSVESEGELPSCWSFTGGQAIGAGKLQRKISKSSSGEHIFTCTAGVSWRQTKIIIDCQLESDWLRISGYDNCPPNQSPPVCLYSDQDICGNTIELWCEGAYTLKYNGIVIGTCIYSGGLNQIWYRMTEQGCFHSTWHITTERGTSQGTPGKYDWKVWRYDCCNGNLQETCRESASWNDNWSDPGNTPNGVTAGDPSACP